MSEKKSKEWLKVGLTWAVLTFIIIEIIFPLLRSKELDWKEIAIMLPIWLIAGLIFGKLTTKE